MSAFGTVSGGMTASNLFLETELVGSGSPFSMTRWKAQKQAV